MVFLNSSERERQDLLFLRFNMKPMLPTLKEKKRYIVFEVISEKKQDIKITVEKIIQDFLGKLLINKSGARVIKTENNKGIIRVNHNFVNEVKASFVVSDIPETIIRSIKTSGTLKKAKKIIGEAA